MRRHHAGVLTVLALAVGAAAPVSPAAAEPSDVQPSAPVTTLAPQITGQVAVGHTLEVSDGQWDVAGVTYSYQWLSDGVPVPGAVYGAFDLRRSDVGKRISAVVTASAPDRPSGSAGDTSRPVAPASTTTKVLVPHRTRAGRTVRLRVQVTAYKLAPRGAVRVTYGGRVVAKRLRLRGGQAGVTLPRRRAGRFRVTVVYLPADAFRASTGRAKVRVRR